jgi:Rrf2 family transcriptional regulator, iron-sulfur cluster assembly transcription factor
LWRHLDTVMMEHMATISLQSLVDEQLSAGVQIEQRPTRRQPPPPPTLPAIKPVNVLRMMVPNSVFALGRSFAR